MRENILFGKCYDPKRYFKVLDSCALTSDLEVLPNGDMTEIGERVSLNVITPPSNRIFSCYIKIGLTAVYLTADTLVLRPLSSAFFPQENPKIKSLK